MVTFVSTTEFLKANPTVKRSTLYERLRDGTIPAIKLGKRYVIPADALERMLESAEAEVAQD